VDEAHRAFEEGVQFDSSNAGVYFGVDSTLALRGVSPGERARSFERFPRHQEMPTAMVYRLTGLLAQAGRLDSAEAMLRRSFFARVEGGTNVRNVWLDVRLRRAESLAAAGDCGGARRIVAGLGHPVSGYPFTRDGLVPLLTTGAPAERVAKLQRTCVAGR
jgi:hypothetical protein